MQKWEYDVDLISLKLEPSSSLADQLLFGSPKEALSRVLNHRGAFGWGLVSTLSVDSTHIRAIFKKPAETPEERSERVVHEGLMRRSRGRLSS
jgi:hypothetical protein